MPNREKRNLTVTSVGPVYIQSIEAEVAGHTRVVLNVAGPYRHAFRITVEPIEPTE